MTTATTAQAHVVYQEDEAWSNSESSKCLYWNGFEWGVCRQLMGELVNGYWQGCGNTTRTSKEDGRPYEELEIKPTVPPAN